jgi:hypothetical protein
MGKAPQEGWQASAGQGRAPGGPPADGSNPRGLRISSDMDNPAQPAGRAKFITDMGSPITLDNPGGTPIELGRYGVWAYDTSRGKYQVVEVSNDLPGMQRTHGVPDTQVIPIGRKGGESNPPQ